MHVDIVDLRQFYHTMLGHAAEQSITMALSSLWARLPEERLVGLGYSVPYLDRFRADTERTFAFMPAGQGAVNWPPGELSATSLVFDEELPLPDSSIDRVLMVHSLNLPRIRARRSRKSGGFWHRVGGWSWLCPIVAGSGRGWSIRLLAPAAPILGAS